MVFLLGFDYIPHEKRLLKECFSLLSFSLLSIFPTSRQLGNLNLSCIWKYSPLALPGGKKRRRIHLRNTIPTGVGKLTITSAQRQRDAQ